MKFVRLSVEQAGARWAIKHEAGILGYADSKTEAWLMVESLVCFPGQSFSRRSQEPMRYRQINPTFRPEPITVLIVENEALVRLELIDRLTEMGMTALGASDADEAISLLDRHPEIEVLLTDIKMPNGSMDGVRLAHHVRERWPPVKIIVISGLLHTDPRDLPHDSLFLPKPCLPEELMDALAQMIGRSGAKIANGAEVTAH